MALEIVARECTGGGDLEAGLEVKNEIFFRYVRRREEAEGSGLGLSLVMALTDRYKGKVWVEDRVPGSPGKGARFVVELPLA